MPGTENDGHTRGAYPEHRLQFEDHNSNHTEIVGNDGTAISGPLTGSLNSSANPELPELATDTIDGIAGGGGASGSGTNSSHDQYRAEITLDVRDDSVYVNTANSTGGTKAAEPDSSWFRLEDLYPRRASGVNLEAVNALNRLTFVSRTSAAHGWPVVEKRFSELSTDGLLPRSLFATCIGMAYSREFAGELFDALSRRRKFTGDSISKAQLREFWDQISDISFDSRLQTFFDMIDKDGDGRITEEELVDIILVSSSANNLSYTRDQAEEYAEMIMEKLDPDNLGYFTIVNLEMLLLQPLTNNTSKIEVPKRNEELKQLLQQKRGWFQDIKYMTLDNWQKVLVVALWIGSMLGLFAWKFVQYHHRAAYDVMGYCVCMAKGAAETLKLNMALVLLPVCQNTITWLRSNTNLGVVLPFDDNLKFHKGIAVAIAIGVGIHTICHLACAFPRLVDASPAKYGPMVKHFGKQPLSYWHLVKGFEGVSGIIMVLLMAIPFMLATNSLVRRRVRVPRAFEKFTGFNAFWYSHHLFFIVYPLLIVHGIKLYLAHNWYEKTTWMYLAVPVMLYACERLIKALRPRIEPVKILKVTQYPGKVVALYMTKPEGLKYKSGQYMFINCPAVSPLEWHPFHFTSAPGDDYLSFHIRTLGDWTQKLWDVISKVCQPALSGENILLRAHCLHGQNYPDFPRVSIDGPYGASTQDYRKYEVVLLIGLGIGAAPMVSIAKDMVNNMKALEKEELAEGDNFKTRKAYFYWVTREQGSFQWFKEVFLKGIMNEMAQLKQKEVIEMHNYCTSIYEEGDARSALISMLQSLIHAKNGLDIVSGVHCKSHFSKPQWRNVYQYISSRHENRRVGVFYCGTPLLMPELRRLALDFSRMTSTKFEFHDSGI